MKNCCDMNHMEMAESCSIATVPHVVQDRRLRPFDVAHTGVNILYWLNQLWRGQGMGLSQGRQHNNNFNNNFFNGVTERA